VNGPADQALDMIALRSRTPEDIARRAARRLAGDHPFAAIKPARIRRGGWGLAATVTGMAVSGTVTVLGTTEEVSDWLDLIAEGRRLTRDHSGARVRVMQDAAGIWVLNVTLGDDSAQGAASLVNEWLALKDPAEKAPFDLPAP
jgi:hypothetical protein